MFRKFGAVIACLCIGTQVGSALGQITSWGDGDGNGVDFAIDQFLLEITIYSGNNNYYKFYSEVSAGAPS